MGLTSGASANILLSFYSNMVDGQQIVWYSIILYFVFAFICNHNQMYSVITFEIQAGFIFHNIQVQIMFALHLCSIFNYQF